MLIHHDTMAWQNTQLAYTYEQKKYENFGIIGNTLVFPNYSKNAAFLLLVCIDSDKLIWDVKMLMTFIEYLFLLHQDDLQRAVSC